MQAGHAEHLAQRAGGAGGARELPPAGRGHPRHRQLPRPHDLPQPWRAALHWRTQVGNWEIDK